MEYGRSRSVVLPDRKVFARIFTAVETAVRETAVVILRLLREAIPPTKEIRLHPEASSLLLREVPVREVMIREEVIPPRGVLLPPLLVPEALSVAVVVVVPVVVLAVVAVAPVAVAVARVEVADN